MILDHFWRQFILNKEFHVLDNKIGWLLYFGGLKWIKLYPKMINLRIYSRLSIKFIYFQWVDNNIRRANKYLYKYMIGIVT